jgi:nucleoside-diphosphate-sugar epimerase/predicted dehydrogenase
VKGLRIGVNHNMVFHPAVRRLERDVRAGRLGRLEHLAVVHNVPLRQLLTGDVGHFMFRREENILFEQAVHPFSVVHELLGACRDVEAQVERIELPNGAPFVDRWQLSLRCRGGTAQVLLAFGRDHLETTIHAIGTDGSARLDLARNTYVRTGKTRWLDPFDAAANGLRGGLGLVAQGTASAANYVLTLCHLRGTTDPYLVSMEDSLLAFHRAVREGATPPSDAADGARVLDFCEKTAAAAGIDRDRKVETAALPEPATPREGEVAITGGTGFLGRHLVRKLLAEGRSVTLLVHSPHNLPVELRDGRIRKVVGDAADPEALDRLVKGARHVVHMATCLPENPDEAERAMAGAARAVAEACVRQGVKRLVFTSTTAALYLGGREPVRGDVPPDPRPGSRSAYSRGKIAAEKELGRIAAESGLPLVILRPAIVVGKGGLAEHSGVGLWVRDNHCVGWGLGNHPLPFVLARDVASAIVASLDAEGAAGRSYNLAGDVRLTAREYVAELRGATGRDYHFHPSPTWWTQLVELGKWGIKVAVRRPGAVAPSYRDFRSRGFFARLDCEDAKQDLGWKPESDRAAFVREGIAVHAPSSPSEERG